jgi:hypothetical protein
VNLISLVRTLVQPPKPAKRPLQTVYQVNNPELPHSYGLHQSCHRTNDIPNYVPSGRLASGAVTGMTSARGLCCFLVQPSVAAADP